MSNPITSCHNVEAKIYTGGGGTSHYYCPECSESVNPDGSNPTHTHSDTEAEISGILTLLVSRANSNGRKQGTVLGVLNSDYYEKAQVAIHKELTKALQETAKAFGGCMACFGKGYATAIESTLSRFGHRTYNNIKFCSCERGKQLKAHLKREAGGENE